MDSNWLIGNESGKLFLERFGDDQEAVLGDILEVDLLIRSTFSECDRFIYRSKKPGYTRLTYGAKVPGKNAKRGISLERDHDKLCIFIGSSSPYEHIYVDNNMDDVAQFISTVAPKVEKSMQGLCRDISDYEEVDRDEKAYLLTWNPELFKFGKDGSTDGELPYNQGDRVTWRCSNSAAAEGDRVYLIRLGQNPKGIIANGTITKSAWKEEDGYKVEFQFDDIRQRPDQGMFPMILLKSAMPNQRWSPQSSGVQIKNECLDQLNGLWDELQFRDSLDYFLEYCLGNNSYYQGWKIDYQSIINQVSEIGDGEFSDDLLKDIWYTRDNGVSSIMQGLPSEKEFNDNLDFLRDLTHDIKKNSDPSMLLEATQRWQDTSFNKTYWAGINRAFAAIHPAHTTTIVSGRFLKQILKVLEEQFELEFDRDKNWFQLNQNLIEALAQRLPERWNDHLDRNIALWCITDELTKEKKAMPSSTEDTDMTDNNESNSSSLNTILYGPPGTGKTYATIFHAVKAADPDFTKFDDRTELKKRYDELFTSGRIRFVTFHQSYSYEDFVEGIRAETDNGSISYSVEPGVFKLACDAALKEKGHLSPSAAIADFIVELEDGEVEIETPTGKPFSVKNSAGSTLLCEPKEGNGTNLYVNVESVKQILSGAKPTRNYHLSYANGVAGYIKNKWQVTSSEATNIDSKAVVLIIDEVNRGNISKIFGELITLIEPSKREGQPEALSVTLPYSKEIFSVPSNLHIIGTMNTADRSLALIDTALRRRFDFKEMMPDYSVLEDVSVLGIELDLMLKNINQRIEYLYDREHTLGHAFFMPVVKLAKDKNEEAAFKELKSIFNNKIIPLLEEYFYEDWNRIRLVLGDNQRNDEFRFIAVKQGLDAQSLFGNNHKLALYGEEKHCYELREGAIDKAQPEDFVRIYSAGKKQETKSNSTEEETQPEAEGA